MIKIIRIDSDDIRQKYSKDSRIEFVCFVFRVGLLFFLSTFHLSNRTPQYTETQCTVYSRPIMVRYCGCVAITMKGPKDESRRTCRPS